MHQTSKKLVLVLATFVLVINNRDEEVVLKKIPYIYYSIRFQEGQNQVKALLNCGSEVNAMSPVYAKSLGLKTWKTNVRAQKIDGSALKTFGMVIADFQIEDKGGRPKILSGNIFSGQHQIRVDLRNTLLKTQQRRRVI